MLGGSRDEHTALSCGISESSEVKVYWLIAEVLTGLSSNPPLQPSTPPELESTGEIAILGS